MSTDMSGIYQQSLFSTIAAITVCVPEENRYRVLSNTLPWPELAEIANKYRAFLVDINNGRQLNLRLHLGAYVAQTMNGWTDRETEEMVKYHAGVRVLCALEESDESIDHTSIADFRNTLGSGGASAGGARAKAVIAWNPETEEIRSGQVDVPEGFEHWLLKFDGIGKDRELGAGEEYGRIEYAYHLMAKEAILRAFDFPT